MFQLCVVVCNEGLSHFGCAHFQFDLQIKWFRKQSMPHCRGKLPTNWRARLKPLTERGQRSSNYGAHSFSVSITSSWLFLIVWIDYTWEPEEHQVSLLHLVGSFLAVWNHFLSVKNVVSLKLMTMCMLYQPQLAADRLPRGKVSWE